MLGVADTQVATYADDLKEGGPEAEAAGLVGGELEGPVAFVGGGDGHLG